MSRAIVVVAAPFLLALGGEAPTFEIEELESNNGSALLTWSPQADRSLVQWAHTPAFDEPAHVYAGPMASAHVSGLRDGTYYFRVRVFEDEAASPWSRPARLQVEHHSMTLVWPLFLAGALVFLGTAGFVAKHAFATERSR